MLNAHFEHECVFSAICSLFCDGEAATMAPQRTHFETMMSGFAELGRRTKRDKLTEILVVRRVCT